MIKTVQIPFLDVPEFLLGDYINSKPVKDQTFFKVVDTKYRIEDLLIFVTHCGKRKTLKIFIYKMKIN